MRYLGFDLGTRSLGISISDKTNLIASTLETIKFNQDDYESLHDKIESIINQYKITKIVLGLPKNMNNTLGDRAKATIEFKEKLVRWFNIEVILEDERLTTVQAYSYMHENNCSKKQKKKDIDAVSACIILQTYLDKKKG